MPTTPLAAYRGWGHDVASAAFDQAWTLAYNPAAQIAGLSGTNSAWTRPVPVSGGLVNRTHDGLNRITGLSWDARGNLTGDGTRTFTYDWENRLMDVTVGGTNVAMVRNDPQGRPFRIGTSAAPIFTLYSGPMLVGEYDSSNVLIRRHVPGPGVDEPLVTYEGSGTTDRRWLHPDRQGSITAWSDASGVVTAGQISTYGPWGEPTSWTGPRYRYTGQIALPEAQLYHYKARVYDPVLGRFLQTDPVGFQDQLNLYAYVAGDPVNLNDPSGMAGCGASRVGSRIPLTAAECQSWMAKQAQGLLEVRGTRAALEAWRRDPNSRTGRNFAQAMTNSFGEGALSDGNINKLEGVLDNLEDFYTDPGTARGGQHDVYRASTWSDGGTVIAGQVSFGARYFNRDTMSEYSRRATVHEPLHRFGIGDRSAERPGIGFFPVVGADWAQWYADDNPRGARNNADNWACLIVRSCGSF